jgi:hypothetical protein
MLELSRHLSFYILF